MAKGNTKYNKTKFFLCFALVVGALAGIAHLCKLSPIEEQMLAKRQQRIEQDSVAASPEPVCPEPVEGVEGASPVVTDPLNLLEEEVQTTLRQAQGRKDNGPLSSQEETLELMEEAEELTFEDKTSDTILIDSTNDTPWTNMFVSSKVWSYPECFPDSNSTQLVAAESNGVSPAESREIIKEYVKQGLLTDISSSPYYIVEDLTHSMPYLVPKAQLLLNTIGLNFVDSLQSKGLALHLPVVTSVLRTANDIRNLQQGNLNSVTNSCHCYGTTIDITYNRFVPLVGSGLTRYDDNLKKVLAEVLYDLRAEGRCYVKYERLQACFHLTVR